MKVLLVEDDPVLGKGLQVTFELEGYSVLRAQGLREAERILREDPPKLVLLDLSLPDGDGLEFLKEIRRKGFTVPVVILTARTDEETVVRGLRLGANDYVRKPFGNKELLARVEAALRGPTVGGSRLAYDRLVVQVDRRKAFFNGVDMDLKRREFDLLQHLVEHSDAVVTRESLLDRFDADGEIFDRTVDSHVSHLRTKLRQAGADTIRITSVYGIGYRLEME